MATIARSPFEPEHRRDMLSGTPRAHAIDRWIYVFMAGWFIAIVLTGFIPDVVGQIAAVKAGQRPPFSWAMHVHAVLMGSFLLLLLTQTILVARGRCDLHRKFGLVGVVLAPALVIAGVILSPTFYHSMWNAAQFGSAPVRKALMPVLPLLDNILLLQIQAGMLFSLFLVIGLRARERDAGFHKRMMILATAVPLGAAIDRMIWLPTTMPASPLASDLYIMLAVSPMFGWDIIRNRSVHRAYWVWIPAFLAASLVANLMWDTPWWHVAARRIMGV